MRRKSIGAIALLLALNGAAAADAELSACAALPADAERLACYDRLAGRAASSSAPAAAATTRMPPADNFGADQMPRAPVADMPDVMHARVLGQFDEWKRGQLLTLDNGQVWKCIEAREFLGAQDDPAVIIDKSLFGNYFLRLASGGAGTRVKRVK